jgi:hypothetical protein
MLLKNSPKKQLFSIILVRMILDGIAGVQFIFQGKFKHFLAILKAHFQFYNLFSTHYKKRGQFQTEKYFITKSIVYLYFIKGIKVFKNTFETHK